MSVTIDLADVTHRYDPGGPASLDRVSLRVAAGTITTVLGPSGCGKSTMLAVIAGTRPADAGALHFDGRAMDDVPAAERGVGMVLQSPFLFPHLSVGENVGFGLAARGVSRRGRRAEVERWLGRVGLDGTADRRPDTLSGGQQQRVALVRALAHSPDVLLLDEPLASLDPHVRSRMQDLIRSLVDETGVTAIMVTHDRTEALALGDRTAVMLDGRIAAEDAPSEVFARPGRREVAEFLGVSTFLSGTAARGRLTTPAGVFACAALGDAAGPRTLAIRPERVRLSEVPAENSLRCRIVEVRFRGEHWEYLADTPLGGVRGLAATAPVQGGATNVVLPDAALFPVA